MAAAIVGAGYGAFLIVTALRLPSGAEVTGQFTLQAAITALTAMLLAVAALTHPIARERRSLIATLVFSAAGEFLLAMPWMLACVMQLVWFWPRLLAEGMAVPVTLYIAVMVLACAALLARQPTPWTALGAVCFAVSDGMIGIGKFVLNSEGLAVPIWWAYATSLLLITAGFFFGRASVASARPSA
jgi:uncharacterized membrane protein YhhN